MTVLTLEQVREYPKVKVFVQKANDALGALGYTEHGFRHCELVARTARQLLLELDGSAAEAEMAAVAGYLHDMGNVMGRREHDVAGAIIAMQILEELRMPLEEIAEIIAAIGNHDEAQGQVVNRLSAALILADKSDVHRSRVRNSDFATFDIHDRVNYAVEDSRLHVEPRQRVITLSLQIDTSICQVMEYFEIFLTRMVMCRRAASYLSTRCARVI
ncbi:MAG: HD domain-containing protein, partial [Bacillota bacterium]